MGPSMLLRGVHALARAGTGMLTAASAVPAADRAPVPLAFALQEHAAACVLTREGRPVDDGVLRELGRQYGRQPVTLSASASISYRCIGGILHRMQQAGFQRVNFQGL